MAANGQQIGIVDFTDGAPKIKVELGKHGAFMIPRELLEYNSTYLTRLIARANQEEPVLTIHPTLWFAEEFNHYVNWIHLGRFGVKPAQPVPPPQQVPLPGRAADDVRSPHPDYGHLAGLYLLAGSLEDTVFQDAILDAFAARSGEPSIHGFKDVPGDNVVNRLYEHTYPDCKMRLLLLDIFVWRAIPEDIRGWELNDEFVRDYAMHVTSVRLRHPVRVDACKYHKHAADEVCESRRRSRM